MGDLRRVNRALQRWDEYLANEALPADVRRPLELPSGLGIGALRSLRQSLLDVIGELEAQRQQLSLWERRN